MIAIHDVCENCCDVYALLTVYVV